MAIVATIMKQSGLTMESLHQDHGDDFDPCCMEMLLEPLEIDFDTLPPTPVLGAAAPAVAVTGTRKVTIRIPNRIVASCRAKAARTGTRYQTLIVRTLNAATRAWDT